MREDVECVGQNGLSGHMDDGYEPNAIQMDFYLYFPISALTAMSKSLEMDMVLLLFLFNIYWSVEQRMTNKKIVNWINTIYRILQIVPTIFHPHDFG